MQLFIIFEMFYWYGLATNQSWTHSWILFAIALFLLWPIQHWIFSDYKEPKTKGRIIFGLSALAGWFSISKLFGKK